MNFYLTKSKNTNKKYSVFYYDNNNNLKKINFGSAGYSDFTINKSLTKKKNYILRHKKRENWRETGIFTAGWWSRWLLWNKDTIEKSIKNIENNFDVKIYYL